MNSTTRNRFRPTLEGLETRETPAVAGHFGQMLEMPALGPALVGADKAALAAPVADSLTRAAAAKAASPTISGGWVGSWWDASGRRGSGGISISIQRSGNTYYGSVTLTGGIRGSGTFRFSTNYPYSFSVKVNGNFQVYDRGTGRWQSTKSFQLNGTIGYNNSGQRVRVLNGSLGFGYTTYFRAT